jgi:hypothetical protein
MTDEKECRQEEEESLGTENAVQTMKGFGRIRRPEGGCSGVVKHQWMRHTQTAVAVESGHLFGTELVARLDSSTAAAAQVHDANCGACEQESTTDSHAYTYADLGAL